MLQFSNVQPCVRLTQPTQSIPLGLFWGGQVIICDASWFCYTNRWYPSVRYHVGSEMCLSGTVKPAPTAMRTPNPPELIVRDDLTVAIGVRLRCFASFQGLSIDVKHYLSHREGFSRLAAPLSLMPSARRLRLSGHNRGCRCRAEKHLHRQAGLDRALAEARLPPALPGRSWSPHHVGIEPHRQRTAPPRCLIVSRPVRGLLLRRGPTAHANKLSCWIH